MKLPAKVFSVSVSGWGEWVHLMSPVLSQRAYLQPIHLNTWIFDTLFLATLSVSNKSFNPFGLILLNALDIDNGLNPVRYPLSIRILAPSRMDSSIWSGERVK